MKARKGRLNIVEFIDKKTVRKIGVVQERHRPFRLKVEAWILSQARLKGVNVPRVLDYYRDIHGCEVIVLERIQGKHLEQRISQENTECFLNIGSQMTLLSDFSANNGYGWIDPLSMMGVSRNWRSFISIYVQIYGERFAKEKIIDGKCLQKMYDAVNGIDLDIPNPYLVSRDLKPSNIIRGDDGKVWIIDWENAIFGDPLYDLAIFGVKYGHGNLWKNLVLGYGFDVSSIRYFFYEIIALIGIIDFYREYRIKCLGREEQLCRLIQRFK